MTPLTRMTMLTPLTTHTYIQNMTINADIHDIDATPVISATSESDCGVYASAVAIQWAQGKSLPSSGDVSSMRHHLISCLKNATVQSFREGPRKRDVALALSR